MPVAKITGQGLIAIACSVALLWGCLLGERLMLHAAANRRVRVLHEIERMQRLPHPAPSTEPMPSGAHGHMISEG
jgi:hypothetical protein